MKVCRICNKKKRSNHFHRNRSSKDGLQTRCKTCDKVDRLERYKINKVSENASRKRWYEANKERESQSYRDWYKENKDHVSQMGQAWRQANPGLGSAQSARRRASKLNATPDWLTPEQHQEIQQFYKKAKELEKETGVKYHVDHIIPLQNELVCGLHVPWNLQILTASENCAKNNKLTL